MQYQGEIIMKTFKELLESEKSFKVMDGNNSISSHDKIQDAISAIDSLFRKKENQNKKYSIAKNGKIDRTYSYSNGLMKLH